VASNEVVRLALALHVDIICTSGTPGAEEKMTKRVLIVDDQPRVLDVLREILASFKHGYAYEITTALSVADTLAILQGERFDLILLDMVMPGIGDPLLRRQGLDLLKRVRDLGVNAPVLMMSGDWDSQREADALVEGAAGFLHKPFDVRELDHLVAHTIASAT
jgi:DNA-binding NtrC family response regulator